FFTTAYWAFSPSERRSCLSWATVRPRYSVSTAALELRNWSVNAATAAALSGLALEPRPPSGWFGPRGPQGGLGKTTRPGAGARGETRPVPARPCGRDAVRQFLDSQLRGSHAVQRILRPPHPPTSARQRPAVFGFLRRVRDRIAGRQLRSRVPAGDARRAAGPGGSALPEARHQLREVGGLGGRRGLDGDRLVHVVEGDRHVQRALVGVAAHPEPLGVVVAVHPHVHGELVDAHAFVPLDVLLAALGGRSALAVLQ